MNTSKAIEPSRVSVSVVTLVGWIITALLLPAYGQQEVDPTIFDPWVIPQSSVVVHSSPPRVALPGHQRTMGPVLSTRLQRNSAGNDPRRAAKTIVTILTAEENSFLWKRQSRDSYGGVHIGRATTG